MHKAYSVLMIGWRELLLFGPLNGVALMLGHWNWIDLQSWESSTCTFGEDQGILSSISFLTCYLHCYYETLDFFWLMFDYHWMRSLLHLVHHVQSQAWNLLVRFLHQFTSWYGQLKIIYGILSEIDCCRTFTNAVLASIFPLFVERLKVVHCVNQ